MKRPWSAGKIAIIEFEGVIGRRVRPQIHLPLIERARRSKRVKALVLIIDSPGGPAATSEELYLAVAKVAEVKPVVAYIRGMGASGALYISVAAHKIVALRGAVVGSIGVIFSRLVAERLFERVGVSFSVQKTGANKDMFGPWRGPTPEEEQKLQAMLEDVFDRFVEVVAQGRKMDASRVRELATGELYSAQRAQSLGLIDELGDLDTALDMAASMAGIERREVYLRPRRPRFSLRGVLGRDMASGIADALLDEIEASTAGRLWM